ncbi:TraR/DksA C4-type zinc finger protein [Streptomyces sp. NPDC059506]|uniref:TraR/DksA C4-type zinc finger protein n=1 Tax=Streptomyces TaxID=1883 RepID=UPI000CA6DDB5|nr:MULTISPECIES: TraR/DksA C4-type zinc finger protein [unclassified Streptomyces]MCZ2527381.1 TraR/DksA C4-type zinc finger protein [Streptomyces sp. HB2AG]PLW65851.1 molecular chaperone DnaK [Streptomyces sp. DJ]QMV24402.1 molecular chaperone DnaK [Streptomyces sp. SCUT-3]
MTSLDTERPDSPHERVSAHDARQWLARERNARLTQLDAIEQSGQKDADELMAAQTVSLRRVLKEIDHAEQRLEAGKYGVCEECARPVAPERLEILPYARCCVSCQKKAV